MMYEVKLFEFGETQSERTLFRSAVESDCWEFIRSHLTCGVPSIRNRAKNYVVMDSLRRCYDPSYDVYILKKVA